MGFYHVNYTMNTTKVDLQCRLEHSREVLKLTRVVFGSACNVDIPSMLNRFHYKLTDLCRTVFRPSFCIIEVNILPSTSESAGSGLYSQTYFYKQNICFQQSYVSSNTGFESMQIAYKCLKRLVQNLSYIHTHKSICHRQAM